MANNKCIDFLLFICLLAIWSWSYTFYRLYYSRRLHCFSSEVRDIGKVVLTVSLIIFLTGIILQRPYLGLGNVFTFAFYISVFTVVFRFLLRISLRHVRVRGRNLRNSLVVGTNKTAYAWAENIKSSPELGIRIFGFIDDKIIEKNTNWTHLGKIDNLSTMLRENVVDEVVIALPIRSHYALIQRVILFAEKQGIPVRYAFPLFDTMFDKTRINSFTNLDKAGFMIAQCPY